MKKCLLILIISISITSCSPINKHNLYVYPYPCPGIPKEKYEKCGCTPRVQSSIDILNISNLPPNITSDIENCITSNTNINSEVLGKNIAKIKSDINSCVREKSQLNEKAMKVINKIIDGLSDPSEDEIRRWNDCMFSPEPKPLREPKPKITIPNETLISVGSGIAAIIFKMRADGYHEDQKTAKNLEDYREARDNEKRYDNVSYVSGGISVISLGFSIYKFFKKEKIDTLNNFLDLRISYANDVAISLMKKF